MTADCTCRLNSPKANIESELTYLGAQRFSVSPQKSVPGKEMFVQVYTEEGLSQTAGRTIDIGEAERARGWLSHQPVM